MGSYFQGGLSHKWQSANEKFPIETSPSSPTGRALLQIWDIQKTYSVSVSQCGGYRKTWWTGLENVEFCFPVFSTRPYGRNSGTHLTISGDLHGTFRKYWFHALEILCLLLSNKKGVGDPPWTLPLPSKASLWGRPALHSTSGWSHLETGSLNGPLANLLTVMRRILTRVIDWMFVYPQNSCVEALNHNGVRRWLALYEVMRGAPC